MPNAYSRLLRYLIAGVTGTVVNVALLYVFTDVFHIWYLLSAVLSFSLSVLVSFVLQKFWTFQDPSKESVHHQVMYYAAVSLTNLALNTAILYGLVDFFHVHYLVGQVIASGIIACESYVVYHYIFKRRSDILEA